MPAPPQPRRALAAAVLIVVAGVLPGFLVAALAPRIGADFPFSEAALGLTWAVVNVACALTSSPSGHVVERLGPNAGMRASAAMTGLSCAGVALTAGSTGALIAWLVIGAVGNALCVPAGSGVLNRHVSGSRHGLAFGAMQAGAPVAAIAAGLALPAVAIPFGWRWAFAATAVLAAVAVVVAPPTPRRRPPPAPAGAPRRRRPGTVYALALTALLGSAATNGLVSFIVLYAVHSGFSEGEAGLLLSALSLCAAASRIVLGVAVDRTGADPLRPVAAMLVAGAAGLTLLIVGTPLALIVGALLAGGMGWAWTGVLTAAVVRQVPEAPAWGTGVMMAGLFVGAVTGPLLVGLLADAQHYAAAWLVTAGFALLAAATVVLVTRGSARPGPAAAR